MVDMIMEMKFRTKNYSQAINRVSLGCRGLTKFIIIDQYVGSPGDGHNFKFY
jgi:hypothetical protein